MCDRLLRSFEGKRKKGKTRARREFLALKSLLIYVEVSKYFRT